MILALDSSGGELLAALLADDLSLAAGIAVPGRRHQEGILEAVEALVGSAAAVRDLDAIAVVRGPGSQTGLRVGLAAAEGLAFATRRPLLGLSSLHVAAHRAGGGDTVVGAVSAGRRNVYAQVFVRRDVEAFDEVGRRVLGPARDIRQLLGVDEEIAVGAEPAVLAEAASEGTRAGDARGGAEALANAVRDALKRADAVAYHGLTGDYGE